MQNMEAKIQESTRFWRAVRKAPYRNQQWYDTLKHALQHGAPPPDVSRDRRRRLRRWTDLFTWANNRVELHTSMPLPHRVALYGDDEPPEHHYIVADPSRVKDIIRAMYENPNLGFTGAESLYKQLRLKYLNVRRKDVEQVLKSYVSRRLGYAPKSKDIVTPVVTEKNNQTWQADLIDVSSQNPKRTQKNNGHVYILNCIDAFSRFLVVSEPMKNKSSAVVASLIQIAFQNYGPPDVLRTDGGDEFEKHLEVLCERFGVEHKVADAYKKGSVGAVERVNADTRRHIRDLQTQRLTDVWWTYIPAFRYSYNT